jgi:hypothetical protein
VTTRSTPSTGRRGTGVDLAFHAVLRFPGDVVAQFECSFAHARGQRLEAVAEDGIVVVAAPFRPTPGSGVTLVRGDETRKIEIRKLACSRWSSRTSPLPSPARRSRSLAGRTRSRRPFAIDALYRSAAERSTVDL